MVLLSTMVYFIHSLPYSARDDLDLYDVLTFSFTFLYISFTFHSYCRQGSFLGVSLKHRIVALNICHRNNENFFPQQQSPAGKQKRRRMAKENRLSASHRGSRCLPSNRQGKSIPFVRDPLINQCKALFSQPAASVLATQLFCCNGELGRCLFSGAPCVMLLPFLLGYVPPPSFPNSPSQFTQIVEQCQISNQALRIVQFTASKNQGLSLVLVWLFCCRPDVFSTQQQLGRLVFLFKV